MRVWVAFFWILLPLITAALAGDLLYLYYAGAWQEAIKAIELAEVICLYLIGAGSLITVIYKVIKWLM